MLRLPLGLLATALLHMGHLNVHEREHVYKCNCSEPLHSRTQHSYAAIQSSLQLLHLSWIPKHLGQSAPERKDQKIANDCHVLSLTKRVEKGKLPHALDIS